MKKLKNTGAYAYLFPSFLIFGIFLFYPFFKTLYLSLFKTNKMGHLDINWVSDPKYALICVAVLTAWLNSGINFLYFSAG